MQEQQALQCCPVESDEQHEAREAERSDDDRRAQSETMEAGRGNPASEAEVAAAQQQVELEDHETSCANDASARRE